MSVSALVRVLATATVATTLAAPSELLPPEPSVGWELASRDASDGPTDLTFDEYAAKKPDSVAHVDPESDEAAGTTATVEVWSRPDEFLVTEIVRTPDHHVATSYVDQAAAKAIESGLAAADPPLDGAWSYSGPSDESWTRVVSWAQGPYAVTLTHLSVVESDPDTIAGLTSSQSERITEITGLSFGDEASPGAPADDRSPTDDDAEGGGGGIPIGKVLLWLAIIAGAIWVAVRLKRRLTGGGHETQQSEPRSADEIITEARRDSPAEVSAPDIEDIVERARRDARAELERTAHPERALDPDWTPPDD